MFEILEPQQASGANPQESQKAIYAGTKFEPVIPFALPIRWYPDDPSGIGYVYKVRSDSFTKINGWQWVSPVAVVPEEVFTIKVSDYIDTVVFFEKSKEIHNKLYSK